MGIKHLPAVLAGIAVCLVLLMVHLVAGGPPDQITETVTVAQVLAQPAAALRFPNGVQVATTGAMAGTTIMQATRTREGYGKYAHSVITGYSASSVNGGTLARLFSTRDSVGQVLDWYRRTLARGGWTLQGSRSFDGLSVTSYSRNLNFFADGSDALPETLSLWTGDPGTVARMGGGGALVGGDAALNRLTHARTLFATRYTLYPKGTTSMLF